MGWRTTRSPRVMPPALPLAVDSIASRAAVPAGPPPSAALPAAAGGRAEIWLLQTRLGTAGASASASLP
eukprot:15320193-Heterocapsa_arctica.AAC.1